MSSLVGLALILLSSCKPAEADWPQWRGINRDGVATAAQVPKVWPSSLPSPAWRAKIGEGYSSPVVAGGRVYIMGRDPESMETCVCLDARTGSGLWKHAYKTDYTPPDPRAGPGPKSTPTVDGDRVYMLGLGGMFHCLDAASGKVLWKHDFRSEYCGVEKDEEGVDKWFPVCGNAASAIADGDQVIVPVGGKKSGALAAFDRKTGAVLWTALQERSSYGSPIIAQLAGARQFIGFTGIRLVSLDASTHAQLWDLPFPAFFEQTITTPLVWKDLVIVSGEQKPTVGLRITKLENKMSTTPAWQNADIKAYMTSPVIFGDHLAGFDSASHRLTCLDLTTGTTKWTSDRLAGHVCLIVAGDRILAQTSKGEIVMAKADPMSYHEIGRWRVSEAGETWSYPALAAGKLYVKDKENLICFDLGSRQ